MATGGAVGLEHLWLYFLLGGGRFLRSNGSSGPTGADSPRAVSGQPVQLPTGTPMRLPPVPPPGSALHVTSPSPKNMSLH